MRGPPRRRKCREGVANATLPHLEESVHLAARDIVNGLDLASRAIGPTVDVASDKRFAPGAGGAAKVATTAQGNGHAIGQEHLQLGRLYPGAGHPRRSAWNLVVRYGACGNTASSIFCRGPAHCQGAPWLWEAQVAAWAPQKGSYGGTILE